MGIIIVILILLLYLIFVNFMSGWKNINSQKNFCLLLYEKGLPCGGTSYVWNGKDGTITLTDKKNFCLRADFVIPLFSGYKNQVCSQEIYMSRLKKFYNLVTDDVKMKYSPQSAMCTIFASEHDKLCQMINKVETFCEGAQNFPYLYKNTLYSRLCIPD